MLADAFESLKKYDWGADLATLTPIDDATAAAHGDAHGRRDLEDRLLAALNGKLSRDALDYVCRKLAIVGSATAVPVLAGLLTQADHSHMARFALERIDAPEAGQALREALPKVSGKQKVGVIGSLGARRDTDAVELLTEILKDGDPAVVRAAALSLGRIGTVESAKALKANLPTSAANQQAVIDALLACAEALAASNNVADAMAIFQSLSDEKHGRLVRLAATRGMLACAGN